MKHRFTGAALGLAAALLVSCTTNPVTPSTFNADRPPLHSPIGFALLLVPGAIQIANGEYLEAAALVGVFAGSVVAASVSFEPSPSDPSTNVPKPGFEALAAVGIIGSIGGYLYNVIDGIHTTLERQAQYSAILADPRVLSGLVQLEMLKPPSLYAMRYPSYGSSSGIVVRVRNLGASKLGLVDVYAEGSYLAGTDRPAARSGTLAARSGVDLPLMLQFDPSVAALTEDRTIPVKLTGRFRLAGKDQKATTVAQLVILGRNAVDWNELPAIASYIQPKDPPIADFARDVDRRVTELTGSAGGAARDPSRWLEVLVAALDARGLGWFPDPLTPFAETSAVKGRADYLQLPRETLRFLGGDADEIAILLSAICEAAGIETAIIYRPGTVLLAVRVGASSPFAEQLRSLGGESAREWAVLDPAAMPADLAGLMDSGARQLDRIASAERQILRVRSAWSAHPPAVLPDTAWRAEVPPTGELVLK
jgi:hypothetical protein